VSDSAFFIDYFLFLKLFIRANSNRIINRDEKMPTETKKHDDKKEALIKVGTTAALLAATKGGGGAAAATKGAGAGASEAAIVTTILDNVSKAKASSSGSDQWSGWGSGTRAQERIKKIEEEMKAEKILEAFRSGQMTGDEARRSVFNLAKEGYVSKDKAKEYISTIGEQPGKEPIQLGPGREAERREIGRETERMQVMGPCFERLKRVAKNLVEKNPNASLDELLVKFEQEDAYRRCVDIDKIIPMNEAENILRGVKSSFDRKAGGAKKFLREAHPASLFGGGVFTIIFSGILIFLIFSILISRIGFNPLLLFIFFVVYAGIFFLAGWSKR
jgi:hypothetical protein